MGFYKRKKFPVQVKLDSKDLMKEVEKALSTTCLALTHASTSSCVTIGLTSMPEDQLCSNLVAAVRLLETRYPGGWANVRALHLLSGTDSLPFYVTLRATREVGLVRGLKRKNKGLVSGELSTVVGATVIVTPTGGVKVKRVKDPLWPEEGDLAEEVTNEVAEFEVEAEEPKEKKAKKEEKQVKGKTSKKEKAEEESDDEMEDKEMAYMQKIADEEEEMEKKLEASEDKLEKKLSSAENKDDNSDEEGSEEENDEDEADDDAEAENLLSEGEDSESEDELIMKKPNFEDEDDEEEEVPASKVSKKSSKNMKSKAPKASPSNPKEKAKSGKKAQKQKKFVEQKKKAKLSKGKK